MAALNRSIAGRACPPVSSIEDCGCRPRAEFQETPASFVCGGWRTTHLKSSAVKKASTALFEPNGKTEDACERVCLSEHHLGENRDGEGDGLLYRSLSSQLAAGGALSIVGGYILHSAIFSLTICGTLMRLPVLCVVVLGLFARRALAISESDGGTRHARGNSARTLMAVGEIAPNGRFSYMCSLRTQGNHEHFCGAVLIRPNWILTTAHCIDRGEDSAPLRPIVYCGIDRLNQTDPDLIFDVDLSYIHESWDGNELRGYDISLLRLDRNASLALEDLPELDAGDNTLVPAEILTALGWGATLTTKLSNELRMAGSLEFVPSRTCNKNWWGGRIKEDRMICAGLRKERICEGDAGGPLIRPDAPRGNLNLGTTSRDVVLGIASFKYRLQKCGERSRPSVFTRVAYFVDWISEVIGEDVTKGRGPGPSSRSHAEPEIEEKRLSRLVPRELIAEVRKAFKKDDDARAKRILEYLHVNETLTATIPAAGRIDLPLLHGAAMFDAPKCAQVMIDAGAGVESRTNDFYGMSALHVSGIFGSLKVAKVLLNGKNGASVNARDAVDDRAIHKAATYGHVETLEFLLEKSSKKNLFPINNAGASPLHEAARAGQIDAVKLLLEKGANSDHENENGWTALHHTSFNNHTAVVEVLLNDGAKVDAEDEIGETPLHKACWKGNTEIIRILLLNRASPYSRDNRGFTPMHNAIRKGHIESVKLMLRSGVSPNTASEEGYTAPHLASRYGHTDIAKLLIEQGALIEAEDDEGRTPLSEAVYNDHLEMVKLLTSKGARLDSFRDSDGGTLLHVASRNGNVQILKVLLRNGADVHAINDDGDTPLHVAAENGHDEVVEVLLSAGALKNVRGSRGRTPAAIACRVEDSCEATTESALRFMLEP